MTINKFQGKTKEEAIEKAKLEFGPNAVIMNVKEVRPKGFFGIFQSSTYEVTAAIEERVNIANPMSALLPQTKMGNINLSADEKIDIPQPQRTPAREEAPVQSVPHTPVFEEKQFKESLYTCLDP